MRRDYQTTKIESEKNNIPIRFLYLLKESLRDIERNLRCQSSQGTRRPSTPSALLVDKHFGPMATKRRRCKVFAYFRSARGNLKHTITNHFSVQNVMQPFVSILVFKSSTPVQAQSRFIFLLFLLVKFINIAVIIKNINVWCTFY